MKNVPKKERPSVEEQLALMKLAGWQLEYDTEYHITNHTPKWVVSLPDKSTLLNDPYKDQAISRAFGYFIQGLR